jgi:hypothetical protein
MDYRTGSYALGVVLGNTSMVYNPSWKATSLSDTQEISNIL